MQFILCLAHRPELYLVSLSYKAWWLFFRVEYGHRTIPDNMPAPGGFLRINPRLFPGKTY